MSSELDLWAILLNASVVVKFVIFILLLASFLSWVLIFDHSRKFRRARKLANNFEKRFWEDGDLTALYNTLDRDPKNLHGMAAIFQAGFREFARLRKGGNVDAMAILQGTQRAMRVVLNKEIASLEVSLPFFATVGSITPYIGLFGTVWGIMQSFHAIGDVKQATLAMVAPGISEALIATAIGLFAAIPAVIAYNHYVVKLERLNNRYDDFLEEFASILQRQAIS